MTEDGFETADGALGAGATTGVFADPAHVPFAGGADSFAGSEGFGWKVADGRFSNDR